LPDSSPWWSPHVHEDRRTRLLARAQIKTAIRSRFEIEGFLEVECGALQISPGNEAHLHAFATEMIATGGARATRYLHTSPEFASKKLLAAGERRIFDFARVFRNRERGALHAPEFVMLEWYRANEDYAAVIDDCLAILRLAADTTGAKEFTFRDRVCDPRALPLRISVVDAFRVHAGIDLLASLSAEGEGNREALASSASSAGFDVASSDNWADIFSKILVAKVEPQLGSGRPTILFEYPRCEAALARATPDAGGMWPRAARKSSSIG
jgi:lysyl-tRNA synthetase class 2